MIHKTRTKALSWLLNLALLLGLSLTAYADTPSYASLKNTTTAVTFDGKKWYLIDYDDTGITLLSKECVAASKFGNDNTYAGSTVEGVVNTYYNNTISAKAAVVDGKMFLLTKDQEQAIQRANKEVLKCPVASGATAENQWWTCTAGDGTDKVFSVYGTTGLLGTQQGNWVNLVFGVRPAIKINKELPFSSVALSGGANATVSGGSTSQAFFDFGKNRTAMTAVTYTANDGYKFPETSSSYGTANGITVRNYAVPSASISKPATPSAPMRRWITLRLTRSTSTVLPLTPPPLTERRWPVEQMLARVRRSQSWRTT